MAQPNVFLLPTVVQNDAGNEAAPARVGTEKDPLFPKSGSSGSHVQFESDDDFEDIIGGGRPPTPPGELHQARGVTNAGTLFHLLKANFSPALLTMPKAMSHFGLVPGIIGIFLLGTLFTYCIHVLLQVNRAIANRVVIDRRIKAAQEAQGNLNIVNGPSINSDPKDTTSGNTLTLHYDKLIALYFHYMKKSSTNRINIISSTYITIIKFYTQSLMYITHLGCCCVCFLFTAETLGEFATKGPFIHSNSFEMVAYAVPFIICISFIPDRHEMTAVTTVAFLLQLCGLGMMIYYLFTGEHSKDLNLYGASADTWYLYFGLIFYAFEGIGVSMHVESHMARKQDFLGWKGILNFSMYLTIPMYAIVGGLGYWKYGNEVKSIVSFNLPEEHIPNMIQILMVIGVLLTYPFHLSFVLKPPKKCLMKWLMKYYSMTENCRQMLDILLRVAFVVFTYLTSAMVPYLELQLSVLGTVAISFLVLFMPAYMSLHSHAQLPDHKYGGCRKFFHGIIMLLGFFGSYWFTFMNLKYGLPNNHPNSTIF